MLNFSPPLVEYSPAIEKVGFLENGRILPLIVDRSLGSQNLLAIYILEPGKASFILDFIDDIVKPD
jgi:hypothetical protein